MEQTSSTQPPVRGRVVATILSGAALILLIFVAQILVTLEREVTGLRQELASKQDLANLAIHIGPPDPAMAKLEGTCTDCHTKETFEKAHGVRLGLMSFFVKAAVEAFRRYPAVNAYIDPQLHFTAKAVCRTDTGRRGWKSGCCRRGGFR